MSEHHRQHRSARPQDEATASSPLSAASEKRAKKAFVEPKLTRHETLPEVTTGFVGSFVP